MGHRTNLVVVDAEGWRLYYSHWAASDLYRHLATGPTGALAFVVKQESVDRQTGWLDDVWAEGAAVIDCVDQRLVWFGNHWMESLANRRAYLRLLAQTWAGWEVHWAYDGIGDIAAYVGVDRALVRNLDDDELYERPMPEPALDELRRDDDAALPVNAQDNYHLVTVRTPHRVAAWALYPPLHRHPAWLGPGLLDQLPDAGFDRLRLGALPGAGLHVDVRARRVGIWTADWIPGLLPVLSTLWPDWSVAFWGDRHEEQMQAADHLVALPPCDERRALAKLARLLTEVSRDHRSPTERFAESVERHRAAGDRVEVNPSAWLHTDVPPTDTDRGFLASAIAKVSADLDSSTDPHTGAANELRR